MKIIKMESDFMTIRTVTVSGVTAVYFDPNSTNPYFYASEKYCWVKNNSSAAMYVSINESCTAGADGTALIAAGEVGLIQLSPANTIYISGSGSAEIRTTDVAVCPFKTAAEGGGDADITKQYISDQTEMSPYEAVTLPDSQANAMTLAYDAELYIANIGTNGSPFTALFFSEDSGTTWKECILTTGSGIMSISCTLKLRKGDMLWERKVGEYPGNAYIAYYRKRDYSLR